MNDTHQKVIDAYDSALDAEANIPITKGSDEDKTLREMFPANNRKSNTRQPQGKSAQKPKNVEKVVRGHVVQRKKPLGRRLTEAFVGEDIGSVSGYIINEVLIPAAKSTLSDMVIGGVEMMLFGEARSGRSRRDKGKSYTSYDRVSYRGESRDSRGRRDISERNRARHDFGDLVFDSRAEAQEVLNNMVDLIDEYEVASVSDLYGFAGISSNFTDDKYGWTNLNRAVVSRVRDGYIIDFPPAKAID